MPVERYALGDVECLGVREAPATGRIACSQAVAGVEGFRKIDIGAERTGDSTAVGSERVAEPLGITLCFRKRARAGRVYDKLETCRSRSRRPGGIKGRTDREV